MNCWTPMRLLSKRSQLDFKSPQMVSGKNTRIFCLPPKFRSNTNPKSSVSTLPSRTVIISSQALQFTKHLCMHHCILLFSSRRIIVNGTILQKGGNGSQRGLISSLSSHGTARAYNQGIWPHVRTGALASLRFCEDTLESTARRRVFTKSVIVVLILLGIDPHHKNHEPLSPDGHPFLFLAVMTLR